MGPFILKNFKKILRADPELRGCTTFASKMAHLSYFSLVQTIIITFIYWPFSLCKILKKFLQWIQSYGDASFLGLKWFICPNFFFFKINIFIYLLAPFILQNF